MSINVRRLSPSIGAAITGIDLRQPISPEDAAALRAAWHKHLVLILPGQEAMTPEQQITFSRTMGRVDAEAAVNVFSHPKHPEIFLLTNEMKDGKPSDTRDVGWQWHVDLTYTLRPSAGAVLHAIEVPEFGGDTMFANMYAAFETLSPTYRDMLRRLEAVHNIAHGAWWQKRNPAVNATTATVQDFNARTPAVIQSMVRVHPETGRESLLIGQAVVDHIHGMSYEESDPILDYLTRHSTQPEFVYRHRWTRGDVLIWDNRCTMHKVVADHNDVVEPGARGQVRRLHRVTLGGEPSGRLLHPAANALDKAA